MESLLKVLEKLYSIQDNSYLFEDDGRTYFQSNDVVYEEAEALCNEKLITNNGLCDWDNIGVLRNNGYRVFAGEKDGFGWLTGCVQKNGDPRILVYG